MNTAIQFFGSTIGFIPLASPMEPETTRAILNYRPRPKVVDQFNIDGWIKDVKTAAGLAHGVDNLSSKFDVVYLFGVNNRYNAKIDFVTGNLKAEEILTAESDFISWEGFYSSVPPARAVNTKWKINNPGNKGIPIDHHVHLSCLSDSADSATTNIAGISGGGWVPLQSVSGALYFRFRWGTSDINNVPNDNTLGAYTIGRDNSVVKFKKNEGPETTWTRALSGYSDDDFFLLSGNGGGVPGAPRPFTKIGCFTAGSVTVDGALLSLADKNYFTKYGITIY